MPKTEIAVVNLLEEETGNFIMKVGREFLPFLQKIMVKGAPENTFVQFEIKKIKN